MDLNVTDDQWCFACGKHNTHGLQMKGIHLEGTVCVAHYQTHKYHQGWAGIVHGGITATLLDEVMTHAVARRGYDAVAAEMSIRYRHKVPTCETLTAKAWITRLRGKFAQTQGELYDATGQLLVEASAKFMLTLRTPDLPGEKLTLSCRKHVLFDLFGTLVPVFNRDEYHAMLATMAKALGVPAEEFITGFRGDAPQRTIGHWPTLAENIEDLARRNNWSITTSQIRKAVKIRTEFTENALMNPYPETIEALHELQKAGCQVGIISDCSPEVIGLWPQTPLSEIIPNPVLSSQCGLRKPDPAIYELALERYGLDRFLTLYVGDGDSSELPGAAATSIYPIHINRDEASAFRVTPVYEAETIVNNLMQVVELISGQ